MSHLASVLGRVLEEAGGPDLLDDVERLRTATIAPRASADPGLRDRVLGIVAVFGEERAADVARAFTVYFHADHLRRRRPDPLDEVRAMMTVFDQTLFRVAPKINRALGPRSTAGRTDRRLCRRC